MKCAPLAQGLAMLVLAALACTGAPSAMQIVDPPVYVCPSATPRATDTPAPTSTALVITVPPGGWATRTPVRGCIWNGRLCATNTPQPGGVFTTPASTRRGPTATPRPTTTPYPTATPYVLRPPTPFHLGDAIYGGGFVSALAVRARLLSLETLPAPPAADGQPRALARWQIEITNRGARAYETFPAYQSYVSQVSSGGVSRSGVWGASQAAAALAGLSPALEAVALAPGETHRFALAAFIPAGSALQVSYALDPTVRGGPGLPGANLLVWRAETNPFCTGLPAEPVLLPTPLG